MSGVITSYRPNPAGVHMLLHSPDGPMGQSMTRLGNRIATTSQGYANVDTGLMRSRIEFTLEVDGDGELVIVVAARTEYSYYVHEGTWFMDGNPFLTDAVAVELERGLT